jgi:hypothetical protein
MFRVRTMLGDAVESNPYRFVAGLTGRSDSGRVLRLLREGRVADALEVYSAPLLSRSGALAVQLTREQLDLALGSPCGPAGTLDFWSCGCPRTWELRMRKLWKCLGGWWGVRMLSI